MVDLGMISELEDDLRSDRMRDLWKRYGDFVIGICVVLVIGTAAGTAWKHHERSKAQERTTALMKAASAEGDARSEQFGELLKQSAGKPQGAMAGLLLGAVQMEAGKREEAVATYKQVEAKGYDGLSQLGGLLAAHASVGNKDIVPDPKKIDSDAPYAAMTREAMGWQLVAAGKKEEAAALFKAVATDITASPSQRQRMATAAAYLAPEK